MCISNFTTTNPFIYRCNDAQQGEWRWAEIIESDACNDTLDEECRKATFECKLVPTTKDIQFWYQEVKHVQMSMLEGRNFDMFIPKELLVAKKLHSLIEFLLFQEKLYKLQFYHMCDEVKMVSCRIRVQNG